MGNYRIPMDTNNDPIFRRDTHLRPMALREHARRMEEARKAAARPDPGRTRGTRVEATDTAELRVLEIQHYDAATDETDTTVITAELPCLALEVEDRGHEVVLDR